MNWLAHILLSEPHIEFQLGNLLADPLKARLWEGASVHLEKGVIVHKAIDSFTDSHDIVSKSKKVLREKGYLKGVVIDLLYDHFLTRHWNEYSKLPLEQFLKQFYQEAQHEIIQYPERAKKFIEMLIKTKLLQSYGNLDVFKSALQRFDSRISERVSRKDSASSYYDEVIVNYDRLNSDFQEFFPQLINHFRNHALVDGDLLH